MIYALTLAAWIIGGIIITALLAVAVFAAWVFIAMQRNFKKTHDELLKQKGWRDHESEQ